MRNRLLLAGVGVAGVLLLSGGADPAGAAGEFNSHVEEECVRLLEEGAALDECDEAFEAPSPILPETNEIIWGALSFIVVFGALAKFGFPAIQKGLAERAEKIQADVDAAEAAKAEVTGKAAEYDAKLAEARTEAARIIEEARQDADAYRTDKRAEADAEIVRLREQAQADVESSKAQAIADIRGEVATLAIGAAEQVVGQSLDRDANIALIEQFIDSVGAQGHN
jgi:F-type H+-transporting ATPase subunit b